MTGVKDLPRLRAGLAARLRLLTLGCSSKAPAPGPTAGAGASGAPPMAQTASDEADDNDDPCSLPEPKEVEAVLGAPLGAPPFCSRGGPGGGAAGGEYCVDEAANLHYIQVGVDLTGGRTAYSLANFSKGLLSSPARAAASSGTVSTSIPAAPYSSRSRSGC